MLKTHGYAVSAILSEVKVVVEGRVQAAAIPDIANKRVVSVDPGRTDLASCAWIDQEEKVAFAHYSNKEYQQKIGLHKAHAKRRRRMSKAQLQEAMNQLPSAKTPSTSAMLAHISELFQILDRVLQLNRM